MGPCKLLRSAASSYFEIFTIYKFFHRGIILTFVIVSKMLMHMLTFSDEKENGHFSVVLLFLYFSSMNDQCFSTSPGLFFDVCSVFRLQSTLRRQRPLEL